MVGLVHEGPSWLDLRFGWDLTPERLRMPCAGRAGESRAAEPRSCRRSEQRQQQRPGLMHGCQSWRWSSDGARLGMWMHAQVHVCVCVSVCVWLCVPIYMPMCLCVHLCLCVCMSLCVCVCSYVSMCACLFGFVCAWLCVYLFAHDCVLCVCLHL